MPVFACSQYVVLGCRVVWSLVVNVTRFQLPVIAVEVVRVYRMVSLGTPPLSARMDKFGLVFPLQVFSCLSAHWSRGSRTGCCPS